MSIKNCKKCNSIKEISKSGILFCRNCKNSNSRKYHNLNKINGKKRINKHVVYPLNTLKCCKICKINKYIVDFNKKWDNKYGVRNTCKICEITVRQDVYNNPILLAKRRAYNNKARLKNKNNPLDIVKRSLRKRICSWCKIKNIKKNNTTEQILGISFSNFKIYIENKFDKNMSWDNYGKYWHIDHIKPLCLAKTEKEMIELNHYTNLRPLEALENLRKSSKF